MSADSSDTDTFSYTIVDSFGQTSTASVTVTVEKPPAVELAGELDVGTELNTPQGFAFDPTGTVLFVIGYDYIKEWYLSTPFDITTASSSGNSVDLQYSESVEHYGMYIKPDGLVFWIVGDTVDRIQVYTMSTPFDLGTASATYGSGFTSGTYSAQVLRDIVFKPDGTRYYLASSQFDEIHQFALSTNWSVPSRTKDGYGIDGGQRPTGIHLKPDGTMLYWTELYGDKVVAVPLTTPWDTNSLDTSGEKEFVPTPLGIYGLSDVELNPSGTRMFLLDNYLDKIFQLDLATPWELG